MIAEGKSKTLWIVLGVIAVLGLVCCGGVALVGVGGFNTVVDAGAQSDVVVDQFYRHLSAEEYDEAHALMVPAWRNANDASALRPAGEKINSVMGAYEGSTRTNINVSVNAGVTVGNVQSAKVPGTSASTTYTATFANGEGTLDMVLQQQPDDSWQIWSYKVNSPLFLE